jgi:hypothetical protein
MGSVINAPTTAGHLDRSRGSRADELVHERTMVGRLLEDRGDRRCRHLLAADGMVVDRLEEEPRTGEETRKRQKGEYFGRPMNAAP